jgi:hypothetical protein
VRELVGELVGDCVGDWVREGELVEDGEGDRVGVLVGVMDADGVSEADGVGVTDGLREVLGDLVGETVLVGDCVVRVELGLGVRDIVGVRDGVREALGVRDGVREAVGVREAGEAESDRKQQAHGQIRPPTRTKEKEKEKYYILIGGRGANERVAGRRCR